MAEKKKMSVAEILAAARQKDGGQAPAPAEESAPPAAEASSPASVEPVAESAESAPAAPAASKPAPAKAAGGARPSVADMLARARAEKSGEAGAPVAEKEKPAPKPTPKPAEPKPVAAKSPAPAAAKPAGPRSTASVLAAARAGHKPGPVSKSEAAAAMVAPKPVKPESVVPPAPVKPDYAKPKPKAAPVEVGRREAMLTVILGSFLALGFTSLATTAGLWTLGIARYMFPNILREPPSKFKVGFPGDFAPGQVETKFVPQFGVWVVNGEYNGKSQIYALQTICTHLGCTPNWLEAEQKFKCPCHGSGFYKDGINFEGPAPRPLERYAIRISDDGQLEIDKSKSFQEEVGQWEDPSSFVSA